jgi:hypothetical protein
MSTPKDALLPSLTRVITRGYRTIRETSLALPGYLIFTKTGELINVCGCEAPDRKSVLQQV